MNAFLTNSFIFSKHYRVWRHLIYWSFHVAIWAAFWVVIGSPGTYGRYLFNMALWVPCFILFSYPLVYGAIPYLLLKGKVLQFFLVILTWGAIGLYIDVAYRSYVYIPIQEAMGLNNILPRGPIAFCYLCMTTSAASPMVIKFFKLWTIKQRQWMQEQREETSAKLQLLKAQVHPQFLFNTLNNIYATSIINAPQTPGLILKLSSLLSYMLYDCKSEEVRLEKEIEMIKNYIDLEKDRYGNKVEVSWSVEGEIKDKLIAPLLFLPFIENAFKHGTSNLVDKSWVAVDMSVTKGTVRCKIINSKTPADPQNDLGLGIRNVKQRLEFLYPAAHELRINDEGDFYVVTMQVNLFVEKEVYLSAPPSLTKIKTIPV